MPDISDIAFSAMQYLKHQAKSKGANSIHSPFVFEFHQEVLEFPYSFSLYDDLERVRESLLRNNTSLEWNEFGAGKATHAKTVSSIARTSLMPHRKAAFLFRLCRWLRPKAVLELGTSLGLTTAYMASGTSNPVYTFEAVESLGPEAEKIWTGLQLKNIIQMIGPVQKTLPDFLKIEAECRWELAVVDANHRYQPTLDNFSLLNKSRNGRSACIVFDDIYWSKEMAAAWREICGHPDVVISIDLFDFGLVFFRPESTRQQFFLRW
jgi:predicted O-methyltransferase YrrM